jgi:hypothetical protein
MSYESSAKAKMFSPLKERQEKCRISLYNRSRLGNGRSVIDQSKELVLLLHTALAKEKSIVPRSCDHHSIYFITIEQQQI